MATSSGARFRRIVESLLESVWLLVHLRDTRSLRRLAAIIDSSEDAITVTAAGGMITSWNRGAERLYGYPASEVVGGSIEIMIPPDRRDEQADVRARLARGERVEPLETVRVHRSGKLIDVSIQWTGLLGANGRPTGGFGAITRDITERKRAEVALRESEERYRCQYKAIPIPTYTWRRVGDDFLMDFCNDAATIIPGNVSAWQGKLASACLGDPSDGLTSLRSCVAAQRTIRREFTRPHRATGDDQTVALTYVFIPPDMVMVHIEDISEARHAERQQAALQQSEKLRALGQMASGIAHDLNQSLMLIASYGDLAQTALDANPLNIEEVRDLVTTSTQAAMDGGETVKRLLMFTRAAGEQSREPVDLVSAIEQAAHLTAPRWRDAAQVEGRPISLTIEAEGQPTIVGSAARIREAMTNLIFNAVDALPSGGTVCLKVGIEGDDAVVRVTDSGIGMTAEVQRRVFEPFFTTKGDAGTGLGLAMVFGTVQQHGGQISVTSTPGAGTTIRMSFPLLHMRVATDGPVTTPVESAGAGPKPGLRVLAVDDEPAMTRAVARMLRPAGHFVSVAASGEEALTMLESGPFDVILSDMGMGPGMNGWELAATVKRVWPDVRFVLATGWGAAIDPVEARAKGVEAVLAKPYRASDLHSVLAGPAARAA